MTIESQQAPRYGIAVPQVFDDFTRARSEIAAYVERAEELGFDGLWVSELVQARILEPLAVLNYAAARTESMQLGVAIILLPFRIPLQLARDLATLDQLSGGRLIVGFGLGSQRKLAMFDQYGLSSERRVRRFLDALELLKQFWTQESVTFEDDWWRIEGFDTMTPPAQRPRPPIWFGAHRGPALRRTVKLADGWLGSGSTSTAEFLEGLVDVRAHLEEFGRDPRSLGLSKRVFVAVTDDPGHGMDRARKWFGENYGRAEMADKVALVGSAAECADGLNLLLAAGTQELILNPMFDEHDALEALAADVLPRLSPALAGEAMPSRFG